MHGLMQIIFNIIGLKLIFGLPQGYNYNNIQSVNVPIINNYQSTNNDFRSLIGIESGSNLQIPINKQQQQQQPIQYFNKQFFIHTAPDDDQYDENNQNIQKIEQSRKLKKNLRVLFIKSPSNNGLTNAAEKLAKEQTSEHTIIYVLNKYTDTNQLRNQLEKLNEINPNKPEVHFVRYKTNDDAENAKNSIQLKYNSYDGDNGSLEVINEGIPDIISYVGSVNSNQINNQLLQQSLNQNQDQQIEFNIDQSNGLNVGNNDPNVSISYLPSSFH